MAAPPRSRLRVPAPRGSTFGPARYTQHQRHDGLTRRRPPGAGKTGASPDPRAGEGHVSLTSAGNRPRFLCAPLSPVDVAAPRQSAPPASLLRSRLPTTNVPEVPQAPGSAGAVGIPPGARQERLGERQKRPVVHTVAFREGRGRDTNSPANRVRGETSPAGERGFGILSELVERALRHCLPSRTTLWGRDYTANLPPPETLPRRRPPRRRLRRRYRASAVTPSRRSRRRVTGPHQ
jgi:hypothetical protein